MVVSSRLRTRMHMSGLGKRWAGRTSAFCTLIRGTATYRPNEQSPMIS